MKTNKIRTLLFGAGEGCSRFIQNEISKRDFLAIIDNNETRSGELFCGVEIISPKKIQDFQYDVIVITTQWVHEVQKQLMDDLRIDKNKIFIPAKQSLKKPQPFTDKSTAALAKSIVKTIAKSAYDDDVELFVDTGTLLGIIRDNMIMPWDDDIDFAFNISNLQNANFNVQLWVTDVLKKSNLPVTFDISALADKNNTIVDIAIDFKSDIYNPFRTSIKIRKDIDGNSVELSALGLYYAPSKYFSRYELLDWDGVKLKIPYQYKDYLTFVYGDWKTVKKHISMTDYQHLGEVSFGAFKEAGLHKI